MDMQTSPLAVLKDPSLLKTAALINGDWVKGSQRFDVLDPSNGRKLADVANLGADDATRAIAAADAAWPAWRNKTAKERSIILRKWFDLLMAHADDLARILTAEQGKPYAEAKGEVAYGASFDLTPRAEGMKGAIARAQTLVASTPGAWMPQQFENPANIEVHVRTTAEEILADFPEGIDSLITGVGTGGHLTGVARVLKAQFPQMKVFAVEPAASPVISGGAPAPHPIQGIGAGFIPKNLDTGLLDGVIQVDAEAAREYARRSAREEGMLVGISSGATLAAIAQKLPDLPTGATVLGFNYDTGERYLSVEGFLPQG